MLEAGGTIPAARTWRLPSLGTQILIGLVAGSLAGWAVPDLALHLGVLKDIFLNLIKMMVGPLVFASIVQGIAGSRDLKQVGRIGFKSLVYFEVVTTVALVVGLLFANILRPGAGIFLSAGQADMGNLSNVAPQSVSDILRHAVPTSVFDALARGDILQVVTFSVLFAIALSLAGPAGEPVLRWTESLAQVMFKFAGLVMLFAPIGVAAAMAVTIAKHGAGILFSLGLLIGTLYLAFAVFVVFVLGAIVLLARIPLLPFLRAVREPCIIAFATTNSESALPKAYEAMERFGVPRSIVGFVLPTGYVFNLDGAAIYHTVAVLFIAQAAENLTGVHFGVGQQIMMVLTLMVMSKGVAAVPRAALVVLTAAAHSFGLPLEGVALLIGIDAIMDMGRTAVNVLGNCLASVVVARWEGTFDEKAALASFGPEPSIAS
jgi:proton glutamate symport protein